MADVSNGDKDAFHDIVVRYQRSVLNLCYRFTGDREASKDLAQDVFLNVYRYASQYKPYAPLSSWIYRIAINRCLNHVRDCRRMRFHATTCSEHSDASSYDYVQGLGPPGSRSPEEQFSAKEMKGSVRKAILELPARQRIAVILHRYHGLRYAEIARVMDCSVAAVEALLVRATEKLRHSLSYLEASDKER